MLKLLATTAATIWLLAAPAHAGTQLQLQFREWVYQGHGVARLMVTLRNPTMRPFARVAWDCDLLDKDRRLVGRAAIVFHVVPWGALAVDSQTVAANGMFQDGECRLVGAEPVTHENERLYRASPNQANIGIGMITANGRFFSFDDRIQSRHVVHTQEEDDRLARLHEAGQLTGPGYRRR